MFADTYRLASRQRTGQKQVNFIHIVLNICSARSMHQLNSAYKLSNMIIRWPKLLCLQLK